MNTVQCNEIFWLKLCRSFNVTDLFLFRIPKVFANQCEFTRRFPVFSEQALSRTALSQALSRTALSQAFLA